MSKYPVGFCYMCGKLLYSDRPKDPNLICEILVCAECHQKTMETIKQAADMTSGECVAMEQRSAHEIYVQCRNCKYGYKIPDSPFYQCTNPHSSGERHTEDWYCVDGKCK